MNIDVPNPLPAAMTVELQYLNDKVREYARKSKSDNTIRAYRSDWHHFNEWCAARSQTPLPATEDTVSLYISALAETRKVSTITRRLAAISVAHKMAGHETPTASTSTRIVMQGIRRVHGTTQIGKAPTVTADIRAMVSTLSVHKPIGLRNRAIILAGFAGGLRRSEIVNLDAEDVAFVDAGASIYLKRSKTDQEGSGEYVGLPYGLNRTTCPVRALQDWMRRAEIVSGPLFRGINRHNRIGETRLRSEAVASVVKTAVAAIGKDTASYSGHSLRAGMATAAAMANVPESEISRQGRWKSSVVRRYIRPTSLYNNSASAKLGL